MADLLASENEVEESRSRSEVSGDKEPDHDPDTIQARRVVFDIVTHIFAEEFGAVLQGEKLLRGKVLSELTFYGSVAPGAVFLA